MKILFVDDNKQTTREMSKYLQEHSKDYEIMVANNGFQALDKMLVFSPVLIILDLSMPGMSSKELLNKIVKANLSSNILIASTHSDAKTKEFCLKNGASGYLTKPYAPKDLLNAIKIILAGSSYGKYETIFISEVNEKLGLFFDRIFGNSNRIEFQNIQIKKHLSSQNQNLDMSKPIRYNFDEILSLEITSKQRGFATDVSGEISMCIVSVMSDESLKLIKSFPVNPVGIDGENGIIEFFNMLNGTIISVIGNFLHINYESNCTRPYDVSKDKEVKNTDLFEFQYIFKLGNNSIPFTIYLWMNVFKSFEKSESIFNTI